MKSEYTDIDRIAMLFELSLNYRQGLKKAVAEGDNEKSFYFTELYVCAQKIIKDIEKEDEQ